MVAERIILIVLSSIALLASCAEKKQRYNVLFIAVDDLRPELGCYGKQQIKTPHIDDLAEKSIVFANAYCQFSWCSPSRTSLLTGLRPDRTKVYDLKTHFRKHVPDAVTLPQHFKENDYYTVAFGKVFHNDMMLQDSISWSEPCWFPSLHDPIYSYADSINLAIIKTRGKPFAYPSEAGNVDDMAYPDGLIRAKAIEKLSSIKAKPFFMPIGFYKPHLPYNAPKKYFDLYNPNDFDLPIDSTPAGAPAYALRVNSEEKNYVSVGVRPYSDSLKRALIHGYFACTSYIDEQVGHLLSAIHQLNLDENTIVVLWGDHGYKLGEYGHWSKHSNFDVDTKVPLIIYHPKEPGQVKQMVVESLDLYPTLCEMAGLAIPAGLDGVSLLHQAPKDFALSQIQRDTIMGYSIRWNAFRYTQWINMKNRKVEAEELYDHRSDPLELKNVLKDSKLKPVKDNLASKLSSFIQFDQ